jgi:murein DD-endopeptidase MepM/ murein hydrolase activator NlpD
MRFLPVILCLLVALSADGEEIKQWQALVADGFDFPVGRPNADGYYKARGYRANGHLGEDWNGSKGGDSDLGQPVFSCANGLVLFAQNFGHGWGNVVIIRHVFEEDGQRKMVDSLYGHLDLIQTRFGVHVRRGQQIGTIGTGGGLYAAHLHFEIRKELRMGMARHRFPRDDSAYWDPTEFINARRRLVVSAPTAIIPVNNYVPFKVTSPADAAPDAPAGFVLPSGPKPPPRPEWKPDRFNTAPTPAR